MAAQLTSTKGPDLRSLWAWMRRATTSFPVPFWPVIMTRASVGATLAIMPRISSSAALRPIIS